ncbi:MAG TPA: ornithine cyclodeaminase family protein [Bryobacteraceae bacterium]|nr:ornithine cyclodeaminase family protein [Bryobacteraceae bacterium]HPT25976.1 ornithine cyclodeaminase family protein [Bryobacteraceae bacterium]
MLHIREDEVRRLLPIKDAIEAVAESFRALALDQASNQPRRRLFLPTGSVLHQMSGWFRGYYGLKVYAANVKKGSLSFHVMLYDAATAEPLALIEANALGQIRTGAATGAATRVLAPPGPATVGMIGTGFQAWTQLEAVAAVRPVAEARVWSRSKQKRESFAERATAELGITVGAPDTAEQAVRGAGIVITATYAKDPVVEDDWIGSNVHVNAAGSNQANRREIPTGLVRRASLIAIDSIEQARAEAGDLLLAVPEADWPSLPLKELQDLIAGDCPRPDGVTIFESLGLAVEDIAVAARVYERAIETGAGVRI